jgi:hypothetical protein
MSCCYRPVLPVDDDGIRIGLWLYTATFFWQLDNNQISLFVIGSSAAICSRIRGEAFARALRQTLDGRGRARILQHRPALPWRSVFRGSQRPDTGHPVDPDRVLDASARAPYSLMITTVTSALADIADENELKYGVRQEGVLYATRTFFQRVDQALGTALAGWVLSTIAFPTNSKPGEVPNEILLALAAAFALSAIPGLIAGVFYAMLRVTRETYDETRTALDKRAADQSSAEALANSTPAAPVGGIQ